MNKKKERTDYTKFEIEQLSRRVADDRIEEKAYTSRGKIKEIISDYLGNVVLVVLGVLGVLAIVGLLFLSVYSDGHEAGYEDGFEDCVGLNCEAREIPIEENTEESCASVASQMGYESYVYNDGHGKCAGILSEGGYEEISYQLW